MGGGCLDGISVDCLLADDGFVEMGIRERKNGRIE
jgi:hypothetical protein